MSDETAPTPRIKVSWLIATFLGFAIFLVVGVYSKRMANTYPGYDQQRGQERYEKLAAVQAAENKLINPVDAKGNPTAEWVDEAKGTIRIPIGEAMADEIPDLMAKAPAMGNAIPVIAPAPVAKTPATPAGTPAPNEQKKAPSAAAPTNKPPAPPTNTNP